MNFGFIRLIFAGFWSLVATGLFLRHSILPEHITQGLSAKNLNIGAWFAVAVAMWNVVRWYVARRPRAVEEPALTRRRPLEPRRTEDQPEEYLPEFDFGRGDPPANRGS